jgi:hypothetical protein
VVRARRVKWRDQEKTNDTHTRQRHIKTFQVNLYNCNILYSIMHVICISSFSGNAK